MKNFILLLLTMTILTTTHVQAQGIMATAHRGASGTAPENTMASIKLAIEFNSDYAEIDVQETMDGVLIVMHDGSYKRTAGLDKNVWETKYEEVKTLDAGSYMAPCFKGEPVPLFEDILDAAKGKIKLNIELKDNGHQVKLAELVVSMLQKKGMTKDVIITSFNRELIKKVRKLDSGIKAGYIFSKYPSDEDVFTADIAILSMNKGLINAETVSKAKTNGKEVHVWTVNDTKEMATLLKLDITSIITNYPEKLHEVQNSIGAL